MRKIFLAFLVVLCSPALVAAQVGPRVSVAKLEALPTPLPYPYDEKADANALVADAFARAKKNGKRVFIDFGGNWCPDCRVLAGVLNLPEVKSYVAKHYEIAAVDVGRLDRNLALVRKFGIRELAGVPTIVIADADGTPVNISNSADLTSVRGMKPQAVADWLARWTKKKPAG